MSIHCDLLAGRTNNGFVVRVQGGGTSSHSPALVSFVIECFDQDPDTVVAVDLLSCDYLDSTFLGCLLKLQRIGTEKRFHVVADQAAGARLLAATQLDAYLTLVPEPPRTTGRFVKIDNKTLTQRELGQHVMEAHAALAEVPCDAAASFRRIAEQLKRELGQQPSDPNLADTVVLHTRTRGSSR